VDVFAEGRYTGNQLAVIRGNPDDTTMQRLAQEMNYSETTFITSDTPADNGGYDMRIFTPADELPFAGHPTLGTAAVIRRELLDNAADSVLLNQKAGEIPVRFEANGLIWMQQKPPQFGHIYENTAAVAAVLGLEPDDIDSRYPVQEVSTGVPFIITPLKSLDAVQRAEVNLPAFRELIQAGQSHLAADAIFVFAPQTVQKENQLHARSFVHLHGIPEDPATGAANGDLAGWLVRHRYFGNQRINARIEQGYEINRPSLILLDAQQRGESIEIHIGGQVQRVAEGTLVAGA
jgi:trans-2,3-dihydro-3-hydroxyanthranilate isomerase